MSFSRSLPEITQGTFHLYIKTKKQMRQFRSQKKALLARRAVMEAKVCPLRAQNDPLKFSGTYVGVINLPGVSLCSFKSLAKFRKCEGRSQSISIYIHGFSWISAGVMPSEEV